MAILPLFLTQPGSTNSLDQPESPVKLIESRRRLVLTN
uniref:Uncharacterized protein n=1 Tax=Utricularia reniformis TaxID=192314 RepID=A0A1Y0B3S7_9LAMI|nr:hypothetical protein AEK19_MT1942 [Utricularia reniformis]ART32106.1 hypothetical protein AEK19_MT1942 [Utricularia reniformis]